MIWLGKDALLGMQAVERHTVSHSEHVFCEIEAIYTTKLEP